MFLKRTITVLFTLLLSPGTLLLLWLDVRNDPDFWSFLLGGLDWVWILVGIITYGVWNLSIRWRRIHAAGGPIHVWRLAGGWWAVWRARLPASSAPRVRGFRRGSHLVFAGFVLSILPFVSLGLLVSDDPQAKLPGAITLAIELPLLIWFISRIIKHYR